VLAGCDVIEIAPLVVVLFSLPETVKVTVGVSSSELCIDTAVECDAATVVGSYVTVNVVDSPAARVLTAGGEET
jgi:hypothetical protein